LAIISIRGFLALAFATACLILGPRASGGGASDGGLTNPFVGAIASGKIDPGGDACATNGFVRFQIIASGAYNRSTLATRHVAIGSRGAPRASTARTRAGRAWRQKSMRSASVPVSRTNEGRPVSVDVIHTGGV
jgi:hypothetical protein